MTNYFENDIEMLKVGKSLDEWHNQGGLFSEEVYRDASDAFGMMHNKWNTSLLGDKPILIERAEILMKHDNKMIEAFTTIMERKMARYEKLEAIDRFDMSETEAAKIQNQLRYLNEEITVLSWIGKLIIRHLEKWFAPEYSRLNTKYVEYHEKAAEEIAFWKSMYFKEAEENLMMSQMALNKTEQLIDTKGKLTRYQTLFIQNNITA